MTIFHQKMNMNKKILKRNKQNNSFKYASNAKPKKEISILYKLIYLHVCYVVFVCLNLIIFFIAYVNKIMNNLYGFLFVLIAPTLKVPVNTFSHAWTTTRDRQTESR